jgi:hypothetical protein
LSARAGTEVILRFWQPQLLRVIPQVIDSSLRGFATASLSGFSVPLIPQRSRTIFYFWCIDHNFLSAILNPRNSLCTAGRRFHLPHPRRIIERFSQKSLAVFQRLRIAATFDPLDAANPNRNGVATTASLRHYILCRLRIPKLQVQVAGRFAPSDQNQTLIRHLDSR